MPICPICEKPVEFSSGVTIWRDPPAYHHACRPDSRKNRTKFLTDQHIERAKFATAYHQRHQALYDPYAPLLNNAPQPLPTTLEELKPKYIDELGTPEPTELTTHEQALLNTMNDTPLYRPRPPHVPQEHEVWSHADLYAYRGSWVLEADILDVHPLQPMRPRVDRYDLPWQNQDPNWISDNPYRGQNIMWELWHDPGQPKQLNPLS